MKIYLELEIDLLPEEIKDQDDRMIELVKKFQELIPEQVDLSFVDEKVNVHLMNTHFTQ